MKILYVKNSSERNRKFQIQTMIYEENGQKFVKKSALCDEALPHLFKMQESYENLTKKIINPKVKFAKIVDSDERSLVFEFIEGESLAKRFNKIADDPKKVDAFIKEYIAFLSNSFQMSRFDATLHVNEEVKRVFGDVNFDSFNGEVCFEGVSNIDLIFSNIIYRGDEIYIIDYEWVFDLNMPLEYLIYRQLYQKKLIDTYDLKAIKSCKKMEMNFLAEHVVNDAFFHYKDNYQKRRVNVEQQIQGKDQQIQEKYQQLQEKEQQLQEKEQYIQNLELQNRELIEVAQSMRIKNRVKRWKDKFNNIQEFLSIQLQFVLHPYKLLRVSNKQSFYSFFKHLKEGNYVYILERIKYLLNTNITKMKIVIMENMESKEELVFIQSSKNPKVSIVIPVYNQFDYTYACLKSILQFTENIDYEIIIADDVSTDETMNIDKIVKNIKIVRNSENLGFLLNCNNATKKANGEYIVFLNNDTNVQEKWLSSLLDIIENDKTVGMIGSKLVYSNGQQQEAGGIIWNDASGWNFGRLDAPEKPEYNYIKEVDYISGASIMIRKTLWEEIGGFDERYKPAYYEDADLAFEVRKHGYKVLFQPKSIVVHFEGISNGTDLSSGTKRYQVLNKEKFYDKWRHVLVKDCLKNAQDVFWARDRSKNKKHILYIDHYLPHYDQDAGSKATYQYLKILSNDSMQVHFIGDNFYNYPDTPYLNALQQMGIEVLYGNWYANNWEKWFVENGKYFDYVVLSRPHIAVKYIDAIRKYSTARLIYMGHDLHFLREYREYTIKKNQKYLESSQRWKKVEMSLIKKCDVAYFFSEVEKNEILKINSSVNVDVVPLYIFDTFKTDIIPTNQRQDIMFVGGFRHSPNIDAMLWFVEKIWPHICSELTDVNFYIIGSNPPKEILDLASDRIIVTGYIDDDELDKYYEKCKMVVAPLRYGAGIKGKIVDALYQGMPIVTTSIGAEGLVNSSHVMMVADTEREFAKNVIMLYTNTQLAANYTSTALKYCKAYFSIETAKKKLSTTFNEFKE